MKSNENIENSERTLQELYKIVLDLSKKVDDIHRLHFSEQQLITRKNQRQKFLAEILTSSARNPKKI